MSVIRCLLISFFFSGVSSVASSPPIFATGENTFGQASVPSQLGPPFMLSAGWDYNIALIEGGSLIAWGRPDDGRTAPPLPDGQILAISAGSNHALVLFDDGRISGWGVNTDGLAESPEGIGPASAIACGAFHNLALLRDGSIVAWGFKGDGRLNVPASPAPFKSIAAGRDHSLALSTDGRVVAWGANEAGQTAVPVDLGEVVAVACGASHSLALRRDGSVVAWGLNEHGQCNVPLDLAGVVMIAGGNQHSLALLADGTIRSWGANAKGQRNLSGTGFTGIAAGAFHSLAKRGGTPPNPGVFSWRGLSVVDLNGSTARFQGDLAIAPAGAGHRRGFIFATSPDRTTMAEGVIIDGGSGGPGQVESVVAGLVPGVRYYVRAFVETEAGLAYSSATDFLADSDSRAEPDVAVGSSALRLVGLGVAGNSSLQSALLTGSRAREVTGVLVASNRGFAEGRFLLSASGGSNLLPVRYLMGGTNVTAGIRSGKLETPVLSAEGGRATVTLKVSPNRSALIDKRGKVRKLRSKLVLSARTPDTPALSDQAVLEVRTR
jgi:hypothetical protein